MLEHEDVHEALLNETVTDDELREILGRLGDLEFGTSPHSTIRDVAEGTNVDPQVIGRMLADIRRISFEEKYGLRIEEHEVRLDQVEQTTEQLKKKQQLARENGEDFDPDELEELRELVKERSSVSLLPLGCVAFVMVIGLILAIIFTKDEPKTEPQHSPFSEYSTKVNGVTVTGSLGGSHVSNENGKTRPATKEEANKLDEVIILNEMIQNKSPK